MPVPLLILLFCLSILNASAQRTTTDFNQDWSFHLGDISAAGLASTDSSAWKTLNIPHDWSFEAGISKDGTQVDKGGYYSGGVAWYRKTFTPPTLSDQEELILHFDGVYMNSEVFLNGTSLGTFPYGYLSFSYDLTPHLKPGKNSLTVRVDNSLEPSARWYHPCGIYAPVTLETRPADHIESVFITTPKITQTSADLNIDVKNSSQSTATLTHQIITPNKTTLRFTKNQEVKIPAPKLWSPATPTLYTLVTQLHRDGKLIDEVSTRFGIRSIKWDPATGFHLNGKITKLLGVCEHWEGGPVGGAWTPDLLRWKLQLFKDMGCNAIRTSHHPFPPFFYDLCDEMGLMVMDEIFDGWIKKAPHDYGSRFFKENWKKDLTSWVIRHRNHPSVIIYSVGNETHGEVAPQLVKTIRKFDPSRPVTSGHSGSQHMDVFGVNGASEKQNFYTSNQRPKNKAFIATEAPHTWQVRGYYRSRTWFRDGFPNKRQAPFPLADLTDEEIFTFDWIAPSERKNRKQIFNSSYDNAMVRITARKNWEIMRDTPWYAGHFRWTGFDYPGEAGYVHGGWPFRAFMGGALDLAGFKKDLYYFYQSQWTTKPMVHLLPHWTHPKMELGTKIPVWAYSNADEVELFLNGKSLGIDRPGKDAYSMQCEWLVPWEPGTLLAIARSNGKEVSRTSHTTANQPSSFDFKLEYLGKNTVLTTTLIDENGTHTPYADNRIHYFMNGPVRLLSHENGNPVDTENGATSSSRRAFMGRNRSFISSSRSEYSTVTAVGILGSRNGVSGKPLVTIHASSLVTASLVGKKKSFEASFHFTTDGSTPTKDSPIYKEPFEITMPTIIKALVIISGQKSKIIEETFATDQGLYWSDGTEAKQEDENYLQAETANLSNGAKTVKATAKITCVDLPNKGATLRFPLGNNGIAGETNLQLFFAQESKKPRKLTLKMNGKVIKTLTFQNTGDWRNSWKTLTTTIPLRAGSNSLTLVAQDGGGPSLDKILIKD